jgi:Sjoegren syndrome nuclear autoantigen 1
MAAQGASLQNYNNQLIAALEELKDTRDELHTLVLREEDEKARITKELAALTSHLGRVSSDLDKKYEARAEFDRTIAETESAYYKILESSQTLLTVLRRESQTLKKKEG